LPFHSPCPGGGGKRGKGRGRGVAFFFFSPREGRRKRRGKRIFPSFFAVSKRGERGEEDHYLLRVISFTSTSR